MKFKLEIKCDNAAFGENAQEVGDDFWLTRNGHDSGFWDRKELDVLSTINATLGDRLTKIAKEFRSLSLVKGDDGLLYLE